MPWDSSADAEQTTDADEIAQCLDFLTRIGEGP